MGEHCVYVSLADLSCGFGDIRFCGTTLSETENRGEQKWFFKGDQLTPKNVNIFFVLICMLVKTSQNIFGG